MASNAALSDIEIIDPDKTLSWFRDPDGDWAERGFCSRCGSNIFWRRDGADNISITAGTFDEPNTLSLGGHIFVANKGEYYAIADGLPQHEGSTGGLIPNLESE